MKEIDRSVLVAIRKKKAWSTVGKVESKERQSDPVFSLCVRVSVKRCVRRCFSVCLFITPYLAEGQRNKGDDYSFKESKLPGHVCAADWRRELSAGEKIGTGHGFRRGQKHGGHMAKDKGQVGGAQELRSHEGWRAWSRIRKI